MGCYGKVPRFCGTPSVLSLQIMTPAKACLWVVKETEAKEQEEKITVHTAIKGEVPCYEWSEIQQL